MKIMQKTGIFCNVMKDNLILAHSVTCATPKKAILNGSFYSLDSMLCFEFLPFFSVLRSESAVCMLSYIFIFQRALNLSTKINKQTNEKGQCLRIVDYFFCWEYSILY